MVRQTIILLLVSALFGCGKDPAPGQDSGEPYMAIAQDMGADVTEPADGGADPDMAEPDMGGGELCAACTTNEECGESDDLCVSVTEGESFCARDCEDDSSCPQGYFCGVLDADAGVQQCVPEILTCIDRCGDVTCESGEVCNPLSGECGRPLRLCETGCVLNSLCGDRPEDVCLSVPNTPDSERSCFTGCNPEAEENECPADYFCASLDPENDPQRGVCFPFQGTCVDRCVGVQCPAGENCDPVTGGCSAAQYGPCEPGCTNNAQCGGQDDLCLNLGINDAAHCWQECTDRECSPGYDCRNLLGTTIRVCIPLGNDCSACYDNMCFPDAVCDPVADTCEPLAPTCGADADCADGELCDPVSATCVAIGRPCNGSTWAVDCDNAVTKCTSQRNGVNGTCEQLCTSDADCPTGGCIATNLGSFCLGDDLGGAGTCGTLQRSSSDVGRPCSGGGCFGAAPICVDGGSINGFCSAPCASDASCGTGEICQVATGTSAAHCVPANCRCAGAIAAGQGDAAVEGALVALGLSQCEITFEDARFADIAGVLGLPGESSELADRVASPVGTAGRFEVDADRLDQAGDVAEGIAAVAATAGIELSPTVRSFTYPGSEGALAQAVGELVTAAGDTPDLAALDASLSGIPTAVQDAAAPLVSAVAVQVAARQALIDAAWGATSTPDALFAGAPFVLLPASAGQSAAALDPMDAGDAQLLRDGVAFADDLVASADFVGQIPDAAGQLSALGAQTFAMVSIPTSAGQVVIADSNAQTHDVATHGDAIAVLIDLGGDDNYTVPVGANTSVQNGVSVALDLGGTDSYGYDAVADPNDAGLLPSDADGRIPSMLPLNQANGPVSASNTARQGGGRLGVGILVDLGAGADRYDSLRMSQGASVLGLGVLWDEGAATIAAEAHAQGAALGGIGALLAGDGITSYTAWHAAQGFGALGGTGVAHDRGGSDSWVADPGSAGTVLYLSTADRGASNRSLAQGASFGEVGSFAGGLGLLRDRSGADSYVAGTYAQGYARGTAVAALVDGSGADVYELRALGQGAGELRGGGMLRDAAGDDQFNQTTAQRLATHGVGRTLGWGIFVDLGGADIVTVLPSGGGVGLDGGFGLMLNVGGDDNYASSSDATWGIALNNSVMGDPGFGENTIGIFLDAGSGSDDYDRPTTLGVVDGGVWSPGATPPNFAYGGDN